MPGGRLPRRESELVILRIATLRECAYEREHHERLGRRAGITGEQLGHLDDPAWAGWTDREQALLAAADQFVRGRHVDDVTWVRLASHLGEPELIELLLLCGQYDSLATVLLTLGVRPDGQGTIASR